MCDSRTTCDHIALFSNNPEALSKFYTEKLGFIKEKEEILPKEIAEPVFGLNDSLIFIRLEKEGLKLEIFKPVNMSLKPFIPDSVGYHHWGLKTRDRISFFRELKSGGVKTIEVKRAGNPVYFAEDPDGNRIEIRD